MENIWVKPFHETGLSSYHRRAIGHDYYAPFIYHIILKKNKTCETFGSVIGDVRIATGKEGCAKIKESLLGRVIAKGLLHLPYEYPIIKLHQFSIMPDHVHVLLQILFRSNKHLDYYIDVLRKRIASQYSRQLKRQITDGELFLPGYCDKPLYENRSLEGWYSYIRQNPYRLAMRMQAPHFFQRVRNLKIGNEEYEAYGNFFLFRNPDKEVVKISRKDTKEEKEKKKLKWLMAARKGSVLVSPFISAEEKGIRTEAEAWGASIMLITNEKFPERFKPSAHDFELCSSGRLLIISIGQPPKEPLTRAFCEKMNNIALEISEITT